MQFDGIYRQRFLCTSVIIKWKSSKFAELLSRLYHSWFTEPPLNITDYLLPLLPLRPPAWRISPWCCSLWTRPTSWRPRRSWRIGLRPSDPSWPIPPLRRSCLPTEPVRRPRCEVSRWGQRGPCCLRRFRCHFWRKEDFLFLFSVNKTLKILYCLLERQFDWLLYFINQNIWLQCRVVKQIL